MIGAEDIDYELILDDLGETFFLNSMIDAFWRHESKINMETVNMLISAGLIIELSNPDSDERVFKKIKE